MGQIEVTFVEGIGYAAMAAVLLSFLMKSIRKLRLVNMVGCFLFIIYGFLLSPMSIPIIITNTAILCINLYYIISTKK